jgi:hypothetical protein
MANENPQTNQYYSLIQKYFPPSEWQRAYNVMMGESSGRPNAVGDTDTPYSSYGLFQIRALPGRPSPQQLMDPEFNVRYAAQLFSQEKWNPWTVARKLGYTSGQQLPQQQQPVQQAVQKIIQSQPKQLTQPTISMPSATIPRANTQPTAVPNPILSSTTSGLPPFMNPRLKGKSIPEAFYGTKA